MQDSIHSVYQYLFQDQYDETFSNSLNNPTTSEPDPTKSEPAISNHRRAACLFFESNPTTPTTSFITVLFCSWA